MKRLFLTLAITITAFWIQSQTVVFHEDFELPSLADSVVSVGSQSWAVTTNLSGQGLRSDTSKIVNPGDSSMLTTNSFSTVGNYFVVLKFRHIAKIEFFDAAYILVSQNNGLSWTSLSGAHYQGSGQFSSMGNKFTASAYTDWLPSSNSAIPTNSWWKEEVFDISSICSNSTNVLVRFVLKDMNNTGGAGTYGWLIDDIRISAAYSEMNPPLISMVPPIVKDTVYNSGPYTIKAAITDASGVDTAILKYQVSNGQSGALGMVKIAPDTFSANIPFYGFGKTISYYVKAVDSSAAANADSSQTFNFYCKYSAGGTFIVGTGTVQNTNQTYPAPYGHWFNGAKHQMLILASELQNLGASGGQLTSVAFDVATANGVPLTGFTINIGHTTQTSLTTNFISNLTTVYSTASYTDVAGWNTHVFQTPFVWDGSSNLVVETCFDNYPNGYTYNAVVNQTTTTFNSTGVYSSDMGSVCVNSTGTTYTQRPNIKIALTGASNITNDIGVNAIVHPTGGVIANAKFPVKVTLKNFGIDTISSAQIKWRVDGIQKTTVNWTGQLLPGAVSAVIFLDSLQLAAGNHQIKVYSDNPNGNADFNTGNDTSFINFFACTNLLNGTYTIGGTNPDFATFADAVIALSQCGISGPVIFNVASGTYNSQVQLGLVNGSSSTNTITFKGANNDSSSVIMKYASNIPSSNYTLQLNGVSNLILKHLTIEASDTSNARAVVFAGKASGITIQNCRITGYSTASDDDKYALVFTGDTIGNNIVLKNTSFLNGSTAIYLSGKNGGSTGIQVNENTFLNQYSAGIATNRLASPSFNKNVITSNSAFSGFFGIYSKLSKGNIQVLQNKIVTTSTETAYGIVLQDFTGLSTNKGVVANNFVSLNVYTSSTSPSYGILNYQANNLDYVYNNINITGSDLNGSAIALYDDFPGISCGINILNNNFVNKAGGYVYFVDGVDNNCFGNNYNNLFKGSTSMNFAYLGNNIQDFAGWKTTTGKEANSFNIDPYYLSATNLHVSNNLLNGTATPFTGITTDIDGETRHTTLPDIGADEFIPSPIDMTSIAIISPIDGCGLTNNETVTLRIKNIGSNAVTSGLSVSYNIEGNPLVVTENITQSIQSGDTLNYAFNTKANLSVASTHIDSTFVIKAWLTLTTDPIKNNDTTSSVVKSNYQPVSPTVSDTTINYNQTVTLTAVSQDTLYWYSSLYATTELFHGKFFTTPPLFDTTTYWVSAKGKTGGLFTVGTGTVQNTNQTYPAPYGHWFNGARHQMLILASELTALGIEAGLIKSVAFDVATVNGSALNGFSISLGNTSQTSFSGSFLSGLTTVYTTTSYTEYAGWNTHVFQTPFMWDGVSNLVVETCFDNYPNGFTYNAVVNQTATSFPSTIYYNSDQGSVCVNTTGNTANQRPNMQLNVMAAGCESPRVPLKVKVVGFPLVDAGVNQIVNPAGAVPGGSSQIVKVAIKNYGLNPLTAANIHWKLNGVLQDSIHWTGSILQDSVKVVNIDTLTLAGGAYCIKSWSTMPNGITDTIHTNDTVNQCFTACLNGTYTIGQTIGTSYDFQSFTSAISTLTAAGICGNVTFLVDTGTYNEKLELPNIAGLGPNSRVTFTSMSGDSTKVKLHYSISTAPWSIVKFNGPYYTFSKMTISTLGNQMGGQVFDIATGTGHINIENCILEGEITLNIDPDFAVIHAVGSGINDLVIKNNLIKNGAFGIFLSGSATNDQRRNLVEGNKFTNFYYTGAHFEYNDSLKLNSNYFENASTSNWAYGSYHSFSSNLTMTKNMVYLNGNTSFTGHYLENCISKLSDPALIANNFVSITGTSSINTWYGFYLDFCQNIHFYFNSTNIEDGATGSAAFYQTGGNNLNLINNIFAATTGTGYTYYITTPSAISTSDHNNFYSAGSNLAFWGAPIASITALKNASSKESNSISFLPPFVSGSNLHLNTTAMSGFAEPLASVTTDIDGNPRTPTPTIGAHEVPLIHIDGGVWSVIFPDTVNESGNYPVKAVVRNFGLDTLFTFPVYYKINNNTPVVYNYIDTLTPGAMDTISFTNTIATAGNSTICAYTQITNDSNLFNNSNCKNFFGIPLYDAQLKTVYPITEGCGLSTDSIKVVLKNIGNLVINSNISIKYQIAGSSTIVTQPVIGTIQPGDTLFQKFTSPVNLSVTTSDSIFKIKIWVSLLNDNVHYNDSSTVTVKSLHTPAIPTASGVNIPYATPVTITALSPTGDSLSWWTDSVGGTKLGTGSAYTTGLLYTNTAYWVQAIAGVPLNYFTIGTGSIQNSTMTYPAPYGNWFWGAHNQFLIPASELLAEGISAGPINSVAFDVVTPGGVALQNFEIKLGATTTSSLSSFITGLTSVYSVASYSDITGWNTHVFQTPYIWDGTSNLIVDACFNNSTFTVNGVVNQSTTTYTSSLIYADDDPAVCSTMMFAATYSQRPNMKFLAGGGGCTSQRKKVQVTVSAQSACDIGVISIIQPVSAIGLSSSENVRVKVRNFGTQPQSNIKVSFQVNGGTIHTDTITASIAGNDSIEWNFSSKADLSAAGSYYQIKAWASIACDNIHANDTTSKTVQNIIANYCIPDYFFGTGNGDYIGRVKLSTLDNITLGASSPYYTYYQNLGNVFLSSGTNYALTLSPGTANFDNKIAAWIDFNRDGDFLDQFEKLGEKTINAAYPTISLIGFSVPSTALTGTTRMRVREVNGISNISPCATYDYGETEDYDVMIAPVVNLDAGVVSIVQPAKIAANPVTQIKAVIMNYGNNALTAIPVKYKLNNGSPVSILWTGVLNHGNTVTVTFPTITLPTGNNNICVYTDLANDSNTFNNEKCISSYVTLTTYVPFADNFDGTDYWFPDTIQNQWERGIPAGTVINTAHSPQNVWMTKLSSNYDNNANDYLYSPKFNLITVQPDSLIFWHYYNTETNFDFCRIQYLNSLNNWQTLGTINDTEGVNWYNTFSGGSLGWTGNSQGWIRSAFNLNSITNFLPTTQFRFMFASNTSGNNFDGWAIDDFKLTAPQIANDVGVTAILQPVGSTAVGATVTVQVKIENFGTTAQTSIPVKYQINSGVIISETWTGNLVPGGSVNYSFTAPYISPNTSYQLCSWSALNGDNYTQNDKTCTNISNSPAPVDVAVVSVSPADTACTNYPNAVKVWMGNNGSNPITSFSIQYSLNGLTPVVQNWTGNLTPGNFEQVVFTQLFNAPIGMFNLCVKATATADADHSNDSVCNNLISAVCTGIHDYTAPEFALGQNTPNPASGNIIISFYLPTQGEYTFRVVDMLGQPIYSEQHKQTSGNHTITLDISKLANGIYFYSIEFEGNRITKRMVVTK